MTREGFCATRRRFLVSVSGIAAGALLAACGGASATPTAVPTATPAPAAQQPTATPESPRPTPAASPTATAAPAPTRPASVRKMRVTTIGAVSDAGIYIAMAKGYFADVGIEIELDTAARTAGETIPLLSTGQLDISGGSFSAAHANAVRQGIRVPAVATKGSLSKGFGFHAIGVPKQAYERGDIRSVQDLRGKKFAVTNDSGMDILEAERVLASGGLTLDDVEIVVMRVPDMPAALQNEAIHAAELVEPTATIAIDQQGVAVALLRGDSLVEVIGDDFPIAGIFYGPHVANDRALAVAWMAAYLRGLRFYNEAQGDPAKRREVVEILKQYTPLKNDQLYEKMVWPGLRADGRFEPSYLEAVQDIWLRRKSIPEKVPVDRLVDFSFLEEAAKQLS
ncbi:MAG: ABC transporter substrate-binding protein [Thermomicrobium sp.]|nr:ABC transporter substrate-binding protein [Thermomicrobium sp.]